MSEPWQQQALYYYDNIGEIRFASQFYAKLLSKVRYYPAKQLEDGSTEPIESGPAVEIMHQIQDPGGGRSRLQYDYGRMMFVTGEGVLFQSTRNEVQEWRFLWKEEVRYDDTSGRWERVRYDKMPYSPPQEGQAYRMWTPAPRHSDLADSPLRSVLGIAEELTTLTAAVMATAVTRMTNGFMVIPTEAVPLDPEQPDAEYMGDEDPETSVFLQDYIEHTENQIEAPGSAAARVPFLYTPPYEYADRVRWMATHDPQTDYMEKALREECIKRLALGMDFPPEFLLGMTDANHWTARQVVYDMWRSYGTPVAERFADDLNDAVLRPMLEEEGHDATDVVIAFDDSQVVISPDRTEDADKAYDRGQINDDAYLTLKGMSLDYAASEVDKRIYLAVKLRQPSLLKGTPYELDPADMVPPNIPGPDASRNGHQAENGPPSPTGGREGSRQEARTASIQGAAAAALMRCRELAGVRIKHRCEDCADGHPLHLVAAANPAYHAAGMDLVKGGTEFFRCWLEEQGFDVLQAAALCQQLETFAARTLAESRCPDLPSGFIAAIEKAREVSDAVAP